MATKKTSKQKAKKIKFSQKHLDAIHEFKSKIASLPGYKGRGVTNVEFRKTSSKATQLVDQLNDTIKSSGLILNSFSSTDSDCPNDCWCDCPTLHKVVCCNKCGDCPYA